ncbi:MAG: type III-A CRISPR-associated RAMP protein Csm3 [Candidatus Aenigmatarchaeota archaeon]
MDMNKEKYKIKEIPIEVTVLTGLAIRGEKETFEVGSLDNPVLRVVYKNRKDNGEVKKIPIIPGSSLKGKIRCELVRKYGLYKEVEEEGKKGKDIGEDLDKEPEIGNKIKRLFGTQARRGRLIFSDLLPTNETLEYWDELERQDLTFDYGTETKMENSIVRSSGKAINPRTMERVVVGSVFKGLITYIVENENEMQEDLEFLEEGLELVAKTYLGGCGSRGYGRVKIKIEYDGSTKEFEPSFING